MYKFTGYLIILSYIFFSNKNGCIYVHVYHIKLGEKYIRTSPWPRKKKKISYQICKAFTANEKRNITPEIKCKLIISKY